MQEFKPTHVYNGGDWTVFWAAGEQVMFTGDDVDGDAENDGVYVNKIGMRQYVSKTTMVAL